MVGTALLDELVDEFVIVGAGRDAVAPSVRSTNFSTDVSQMKDKGVDLVASCLDNNGTLTLATEMKKQGLDATQYLPNVYNHRFIKENARFFEGSYTATFFTPFEVKQKPKGLKDFQKWMKSGDFDENESSLAGWINADLFYQGLKAAAPKFTHQKVVDETNKITDYTAGGLLPGREQSEPMVLRGSSLDSSPSQRSASAGGP